MAKAKKELAELELANDLGVYDEGDAVQVITAVLRCMDDKASVIRVVSAVGMLFGSFYVETT